MIIVVDIMDDIEKRLKVADGNTLVVFDCDEVLTTLSEQVWQARNHDFFVEWCSKNISNFSEEVLYKLATSILVSSKNLLVNQRMPELVESLYRRNIKSIVLTALSTQPVATIRDPMAWRISTLENFGYNFKMFWPSWPDKHFKEFGEEYPPAYGSGVICICHHGLMNLAGVDPSSKRDDGRMILRSMDPSCIVLCCNREEKVIEYESLNKLKESLWDKYYTDALKRQRQCVERYKIVKRV
jgi:hypothetical protein